MLHAVTDSIRWGFYGCAELRARVDQEPLAANETCRFVLQVGRKWEGLNDRTENLE